MRRLAAGLSLACVLAASPAARAVGALAARPADTSFSAHGDVAVAVTPGHVTTWVRTRFVGAADSVVWLVPVPPGAGVDFASPAWLDALEDATAPRVLAPANEPAGATCEVPASAIVSPGDAGVPASLVHHAVVDDTIALAATLSGWGFAPHALDDAGVLALSEGQRLLLLELHGPDGVTPTVRIHAAGSAAAMVLARAPLHESFTLWMLGDGRGFVPGAVESVIAPGAVGWTSPSSTTYVAVRDALLTDALHSVLEAAGPAAASGSALPGGGAVPGLVDAYVARVAGAASVGALVHAALASAALVSEACARGDLVASSPCAAASSPLDAGPLATADDLRFAFAGAPAARWLTRVEALAAKGTTCAAVLPAFSPATPLSAATSAGAWGPLCKMPPPPPPTHGPAQPPPTEQPLPDDPSLDPGAEQGTTPPGDLPPPVIVRAGVDMACSCAADTGSSDPSAASNSGCSGDSSSGSGSSGDGSGCSSSSSGSSAPREGSGCSSSSSGSSSGSSSSGCSSSSGSSDGGSTCSVGPRPPRPLRLSRLVILLAAVALPLRRRARPRRKIEAGSSDV